MIVSMEASRSDATSTSILQLNRERMGAAALLLAFWLSRISVMFLLHQTPLPDTALSPGTALAAVKGVLVTGSETIVTVLGMTSVVSTLSHWLGAVFQAVLAAEAEEDKSVASVSAVLFFVLLTFVKSWYKTLITRVLQKHSSAYDPVPCPQA